MSFQGNIEKGMIVLDQLLPLPDGTPVRVDLLGLTNDFWQSCSLDELARRQQDAVSGPVEQLQGGWPTEELDDDFEQTFLQWREAELDERR